MARQARTVAFADDDGACQRPLEAGEDVDQRRLAGAVRADQSENLAAFEPDTDFIDCDETAKPDGHTLRLEGHG